MDVLDVRGPPEQRYWKLWWKPYPGQEKWKRSEANTTTGHPRLRCYNSNAPQCAQAPWPTLIRFNNNELTFMPIFFLLRCRSTLEVQLNNRLAVSQGAGLLFSATASRWGR